MSVITEFSIEADGFQLGRVLSGPSAVRLELERIVPTGDQLLPFVWADGDEDDLDAFERKVRSSRYVEELTTLDRLPSARLYEVEWRPHIEGLVEGLDSTEGSIYEGRGVDDRWTFVIRFPTHDRVTAFHDFLSEHGITVHIDRVLSLTETERGGYVFDLTPEQRAVLVLAVDRGYFRVPRQADLADIAGELDISRQAASERLRRGNDTVLRKVLLRE